MTVRKEEKFIPINYFTCNSGKTFSAPSEEIKLLISCILEEKTYLPFWTILIILWTYLITFIKFLKRN